jgi:hypothetical protein
MDNSRSWGWHRAAGSRPPHRGALQHSRPLRCVTGVTSRPSPALCLKQSQMCLKYRDTQVGYGACHALSAG